MTLFLSDTKQGVKQNAGSRGAPIYGSNLSRMGFLLKVLHLGEPRFLALASVGISINGTQASGKGLGTEVLTCLSGSHLSVLIVMTSLARRSRVPLVCAGFDSLQDIKRQSQTESEV